MFFDIHGDDRGKLISLEGNRNIPFAIRRVYYIFGTESGVRRGQHAHKTLDQVLVCIQGNCDILLDDADKKEVIHLTRNNEGLIVRKCVWHEMYNFSNDAVLLVLASDYYDESDYIRDYDDFIRYISEKKNNYDNPNVGIDNARD